MAESIFNNLEATSQCFYFDLYSPPNQSLISLRPVSATDSGVPINAQRKGRSKVDANRATAKRWLASADSPSSNSPCPANAILIDSLESHLWGAANILREPVDAADLKTCVFPQPSNHLERLFSRAADRHILMPLLASTKDGEHSFITWRLRFAVFGKRQIRALLLFQSEQLRTASLPMPRVSVGNR